MEKKPRPAIGDGVDHLIKQAGCFQTQVAIRVDIGHRLFFEAPAQHAEHPHTRPAREINVRPRFQRPEWIGCTALPQQGGDGFKVFRGGQGDAVAPAVIVPPIQRDRDFSVDSRFATGDGTACQGRIVQDAA